MSAFVTFQIVRRTRFAACGTDFWLGFPFNREVEARECIQQLSTFVAWACHLAVGQSHHIFEVASMRAPPLSKTPNKALHRNSRCPRPLIVFGFIHVFLSAPPLPPPAVGELGSLDMPI